MNDPMQPSDPVCKFCEDWCSGTCEGARDAPAIEALPAYWSSVESEARALCDRKGITDLETYERVCAEIRHRRFLEAIEPYQRMRVRALSMRMLDRILISADGTTETIYKPLPPAAQESLDQIDELIAKEARRFGMTYPNTNHQL